LQYIEDEWLLIVACIEKGIIPDLEGMEHVRAALEVSLLCVTYVAFGSRFVHRNTSSQTLFVQQNFTTLVLLLPGLAGEFVYGPL